MVISACVVYRKATVAGKLRRTITKRSPEVKKTGQDKWASRASGQAERARLCCSMLCDETEEMVESRCLWPSQLDFHPTVV
jgi:hypothetical protein